MKTKEQIQKEIFDAATQLEQAKRAKDKSGIRRIADYISFRKTLLRYIETNPREEFVRSELERVAKTIDNCESRIREELEIKKQALGGEIPSSQASAIKALYEKTFNMTNLRAQKKALSYLLE